MEIDFKTYKNWLIDTEDKRQGPKSEPANKLTPEEKEEMIKIATRKEYVDLSPRLIVPKLADEGIYLASESSFYKVLKENKMLTHRGRSTPKKHTKPAPIKAAGPKQVWSWDITYLKSDIRGTYYFLYMFMDVFSRKIVGFDVFDRECMEHSAKLIKKVCLAEKIEKNNLILHSDNGGPMKGATMLATLERLGVAPSFSRPRVSDDNPYSESLFKTLKYCPIYKEGFKNLHEAKSWVIRFVDWYNNREHSGIKYVTPSARHAGIDKEILDNRIKVYEKAKNKKPNRWNKREIRNWDFIKEVDLNPCKSKKTNDKKMAA